MMPLVLFAILAVVSGRDLRGALDADLGSLPMQNPDLFGGDMLGVEVVDRNVIPQAYMRWTGRQVPYVLDNSVAGYRNVISSAMDDFHSKTCIRFVPRSYQQNYIRIFSGNGCYSAVGMIGGQQQVSLGNGCMNKGIIVHELGHAIGFWHEQNRSDRDDYLIIYWQNIEESMKFNFNLLKPSENILVNAFDYDSIMIYENTAFSKDGRSWTMEAKNGTPLRNAYFKDGLNPSDVQRVNYMYNC